MMSELGTIMGGSETGTDPTYDRALVHEKLRTESRVTMERLDHPKGCGAFRWLPDQRVGRRLGEKCCFRAAAVHLYDYRRHGVEHLGTREVDLD